MDIIELPMALIDEDKDQPRYQFDEEALQELMKSIEELGLLSPIKVRTAENGRYKIIYGNRRYKATERLGRATIPCIVSNTTDEMEIYLEQIAENLTREGFSPIEEAEAFDKLMNDSRFRSSIKFLSAKLGKPESYIKNKMELLKFSSAVKKLIVSGVEIRKDKLTEDQLMPLKDLPMEHRDPLALIAARDELPVSDVKKIAKLFKDKTISDSTKEKLLLKSGPGLIDTWSVYEQNRKERARKQEEQEDAPPASKSPAPAANTGSGVQVPQASSTSEQAAQTDATSGAAATAPESAPANAAPAAPETAHASAPVPKGNVSELLKQLQTQLARQAELTQAIVQLAASSHDGEYSLFPHEIDEVISKLEQQLAEWRSLK